MNLHDIYCPLGADCLTSKTTGQWTPLATSAYTQLDPGETILFHGTFLCNVASILCDGFRPELCTDDSFGSGIYMTPCIRLASCFTGTCGAVFMCRVKLGVCYTFDSFCKVIRSGQDSNRLTSLSEYVIYEGSRILPIAIYCNTSI